MERSSAPIFVLYDARCGVCTASARLLRARGEGEGLRIEPLQSPRWRPLISDGIDEMKLVRADGTAIGGGDAVIELARRLPALAGVYLWTLVPGVPALIRLVYRFIARHRGCAGGACGMTVGARRDS